MHITEEGT